MQKPETSTQITKPFHSDKYTDNFWYIHTHTQLYKAEIHILIRIHRMLQVNIHAQPNK